MQPRWMLYLLYLINRLNNIQIGLEYLNWLVSDLIKFALNSKDTLGLEIFFLCASHAGR